LAARTDNQFIFPSTFQDRHFGFSNNRWRIAQSYLESLKNCDKEEEFGEEVVNEVNPHTKIDCTYYQCLLFRT